MTKLYCLVFDQESGASEDFNFNYLQEDNFEVYMTEEERDARVFFLNNTLPNLINSCETCDEVEVCEFWAMPFDVESNNSYGVIPKIMADRYKDEEYSIEYSETPEGPKVTITDLCEAGE